MKSLKVAFGLLLVVAALYVVVREHVAGVSLDAFVNARLTTISAPVAGSVTLVERPLGARLTRGDPLGSISDPLVDNLRLSDLTLQRETAVAEIGRLRWTVEQLREKVEKLDARATAYRGERVKVLRAEAEAAEAQREAARARFEYARGSVERTRRLNERGVRTAEALEETQAAAEVARRELDSANKQVSIARTGLAAAERGVFLGDGYNDAPYSEQRISELEVRLVEAESDLMAKSGVLEALEANIRSERSRVNQLASATLDSNVDGLVWEYLTASGESVQRGQDLIRLADCDTAIVTLSVSESVYNAISLGAPATFRLDGGSRVLSGTVTRLAGAGASSIYRNLAITPGEQNPQRFDATLDVPALRDDPALRCLLGRTGRVFFEGRPLDWLRQLWS